MLLEAVITPSVRSKDVMPERLRLVSSELSSDLSPAVLDGPTLPGITRSRDVCARFQTPWQTSAERYWNPVQSFWSFEASWGVSPSAPSLWCSQLTVNAMAA